jgi:Alpha/beta hydrolase family
MSRLRLGLFAAVVIAVSVSTATSTEEPNSDRYDVRDDDTFLAIAMSQRGTESAAKVEPGTGRVLQMMFSNYTSTPLPGAIELTPDPFKDDTVVNAARAAAKAGTCNATDHQCMIPFVPPSDIFPNASEAPELGVILYGGGLVDPRSYSVLAHRLATRYGMVVLIPIFAGDIPFTPCTTGRVPVAASMYPTVKKWVLMGHSFGGTAAASDLASIMNLNGTVVASDSPTLREAMGGLVLMASYAGPVAGCGTNDFSGTDIPVAVVTAENDEILNWTRWTENVGYVPANSTFFLEIMGGNHGGFGSYNTTERIEVLGPAQIDGPLLIDPSVQWDLTVAAAAHVASRSGVPLPKPLLVESPSPTPPGGDTSTGYRSYWYSDHPMTMLSALALMVLFKAM